MFSFPLFEDYGDFEDLEDCGDCFDYEELIEELPADHPLVWNWFLENFEWLKKQLEQEEEKDGEENNRR